MPAVRSSGKAINPAPESIICINGGLVRMVIVEISVGEARKLMKSNPDFVILDVRTPAEFSQEHLKGAANINIYNNNFKKNLEKLDKKKTYIVHCHAGVRCAVAADIMDSIGFTKVYSVNGNLFE